MKKSESFLINLVDNPEQNIWSVGVDFSREEENLHAMDRLSSSN
jgi:hypothetical protein